MPNATATATATRVARKDGKAKKGRNIKTNLSLSRTYEATQKLAATYVCGGIKNWSVTCTELCSCGFCIRKEGQFLLVTRD